MQGWKKGAAARYCEIASADTYGIPSGHDLTQATLTAAEE
jgi:hypothetical protein